MNNRPHDNTSVELGTGERLNKMTDPTAAEGGNVTDITLFSAAFRKELVLVPKLVRIIIHDNTDMDYQILVVDGNHLCKSPVKYFFNAITCLILFADSLSRRVMSLPLTLCHMFTFTHLSLALNKSMI